MSVQAQRLRERRKALGMSQQQLAKQIGSNQAQISKYEQGDSDPTAEALAELSRALDVASDWLLGLTDELAPCLNETDLSAQERRAVNDWRQGKRLSAIKTIVLDDEKSDAA
jgi:transcriptional regulator with XRE-family HTH domain